MKNVNFIFIFKSFNERTITEFVGYFIK